MDVLNPVIGFFNTVITVLRPTVFAIAVATATAAAASWAVRTRRIGPFTGFARLTRRRIDPLFLPAERRVVRLGGMPAQAPWWTVGAMVVGGLLVLAILDFVRQQLMLLAATTYSGPRGVFMLVVNWVLMLLKVAIMARVVSSWVGGGPFSKWWGWSYKLTDWMLKPIRKILPTFGPLDLSPLVAYLAISLLQNFLQ